MNGPAHPLVLLGLGACGARVVDDLDDTATALAAPARSPHAAITARDVQPDRLRAQFSAQAGALLEAGASRAHGQARMDVVVVADLSQTDAAALIATLDGITDVLADEMPVLFPANAPPEQRSVWLTVFLATPALVRTREDDPIGAALLALQDQPQRARHPALSRVLLLPRQTTAGRLSDEAVEAALRAMLQTVYLSGARDHDRVRDVIGHRPDRALFASFSVATAELPVARIRRYARWRLALSGLDALLAQAEQPTTDPSRAEALRQQLDPHALLADFRDGEPARRVRERAARISGAEDHLPTRWSVSLTERPIDLRARYRVLFEPIARPWTRRVDPTSDPDHRTTLRLMDKVEADILRAVDQKITALLDEELDPSGALAVLPAIQHALEQVEHTLEEALAQPVPALPSPEPPPPPDDPGLDALVHVIDSRPGIQTTWPVLLGIALTTAGALTMLVTWAMGPAAAGAVSSEPLPPTSGEVWAAALLVGILLATGWQLGVLWIWRTQATATLERRTRELDTAWRLGGAGQEREQADRLLAVRHRRTADDMRRRYQAALERLAALRAAIRQTHNTAAAALADLRVRLGATPRQDDLSGLVGVEGPLHTSLVAPGALAERVEGLGLHRDLQRWAGQLLAATWPEHGGLEEDLPCLDLDRLLAACDGALGSLSAGALLGGPNETADRIRAFLQTATGAIAWGIDPRDAHGDPRRGRGRDRRVLIAPSSMRAGVEPSLADSPVQLDAVWTNAEVPWVTVLATWDGFTADDLLRGMEGTR